MYKQTHTGCGSTRISPALRILQLLHALLLSYTLLVTPTPFPLAPSYQTTNQSTNQQCNPPSRPPSPSYSSSPPASPSANVRPTSPAATKSTPPARTKHVPSSTRASKPQRTRSPKWMTRRRRRHSCPVTGQPCTMS